jgi:hypothetical protein
MLGLLCVGLAAYPPDREVSQCQIEFLRFAK